MRKIWHWSAQESEKQLPIRHNFKQRSLVYQQNSLDLPQQLTEILTQETTFSGTFEDKEITHVEGEVDPVRDLDIINEELRLKDEEAFAKYFDDLEKKYQRGEKKLKQEYVSLKGAEKVFDRCG